MHKKNTFYIYSHKVEQSDIITGYLNYIPAGGRKGAENTVNGANISLYTVNTVLPLIQVINREKYMYPQSNMT